MIMTVPWLLSRGTIHPITGDHMCHGNWTSMWRQNLRWLRVMLTEEKTGGLCLVYKSMLAGARHTKTDVKTGKWRPLPIVLTGEFKAWTLAGCTDLFLGNSGHQLNPYRRTNTVHWQLFLLEFMLMFGNSFPYLHIWYTSHYLLVGRKQKSTHLDALWVTYFSTVLKTFLMFSFWLTHF